MIEGNCFPLFCLFVYCCFFVVVVFWGVGGIGFLWGVLWKRFFLFVYVCVCVGGGGGGGYTTVLLDYFLDQLERTVIFNLHHHYNS